MIFFHFRKVRPNDNFPDKICERCLKRLWEVYEFRIDCQRAHRDMVQKQLNWRIDINELELKNEMKYGTEFNTVIARFIFQLN